MKSDISGFYKLSPEERLRKLKEFAKLSEEEAGLLSRTAALETKTADMMIENVVGTFELPYAVAANFLINSRDFLIPMVIEESSVVAAASNAAKLARPSGGFETSSDDPLMIGQVQLLGVKDHKKAEKEVLSRKNEMFKLANRPDSTMVKLGGGLKDVETRSVGDTLVAHLIVDVRDAMGANAVNTMAEALAPFLEELTGGKARLKIISNLAAKRLARAKAVWKKDVVGEDVIQGVLDAYKFAVADEYRCATHNKGIMNGVDAVAIATGNDFRALESGAHSFANLEGKPRPLTRYEKDKDGNLVGTIELPIAVGTVGGSTKINPLAQVSLKILRVRGAQELAEVMAAVGLAQNFAALRALSTEGIQRGHMRLHAKNIAMAAGAEGKQVDELAEKLIKDRNITVSRAKELLMKKR